jgi:hypothetical protein
MPLSTIFQLYRGSQSIGEGNRRKPPTCRGAQKKFEANLNDKFDHLNTHLHTNE